MWSYQSIPPLFFLAQAILVPIQTTNALSSFKTGIQSSSESTPIKRVGIVGAGIAGLSLAHALENVQNNNNEDFEISLFDSRPSLIFQDGAGVQLNGGMSVLHKINPKLQTAVAEAALPLKKIRSRTKPWNPLSFLSSLTKTSKDEDKNDSSFSTLLEFDLEQIIRDAGGDVEKELIVDGNVMAYTIMRGALQDVLLEELSPSTSQRVQFGKRLTDLKPVQDGGILCEFEDGSTEGPFDLVVGCDGISSAVKEYVDKGKILSKSSKGSKGRGGFSSIYSGIRIIFAVQDGDKSMPAEDIPKSAELRQYFGDGGYGLSGVYGAGPNRVPSRSAFYIFRDEDYIGPFRKNKETASESTTAQNEEISENVDWSQNKQSSKSDPKTDFLQKMEKSTMPSAELIPVVENADRFFELGVYFHNPFSFNGWKREVKGSGGKFCVLAGDAARKSLYSLLLFFFHIMNHSHSDDIVSCVFKNQNVRK